MLLDDTCGLFVSTERPNPRDVTTIDSGQDVGHICCFTGAGNDNPTIPLQYCNQSVCFLVRKPHIWCSFFRCL